MESENLNPETEDIEINPAEDASTPTPPEIVEETLEANPPLTAENSVEAEKLPPTKFQKNLRKVLIWAVSIGIIFLAGILTTYFLSVVPLQKSIIEEQKMVVDAHETEMGIVEEQLAESLARHTLSQVLVDVSSARIALFGEDLVGAKANLANTQQKLDSLLDMIADFDEGLATSMPQRLALIISGLERDGETAIIDLELFTKDLLVIEKAIFGH